jgi:hypothetical protein
MNKPESTADVIALSVHKALRGVEIFFIFAILAVISVSMHWPAFVLAKKLQIDDDFLLVLAGTFSIILAIFVGVIGIGAYLTQTFFPSSVSLNSWAMLIGYYSVTLVAQALISVGVIAMWANARVEQKKLSC